MSTTRLLALLAALLVSPSLLAVVSDSAPPPTAVVDVFFSTNPDTEAFLAEITLTLEQVRAGKMGPMSNRELELLEEARIEIFTLLDGHAHATDLPADERIAVYNAQELIQAIINRRPNVVCKEEARLGTRVRGYTCMTAEQRDGRTVESKETARRLKGYDGN